MEAAIYTLWVILISATTGEPLDANPEGEPQTLRACVEAIVAKGPQVAVDGKVPVFLCKRPASDISI